MVGSECYAIMLYTPLSQWKQYLKGNRREPAEKKNNSFMMKM